MSSTSSGPSPPTTAHPFRGDDEYLSIGLVAIDGLDGSVGRGACVHPNDSQCELPPLVIGNTMVELVPLPFERASRNAGAKERLVVRGGGEYDDDTEEGRGEEGLTLAWEVLPAPMITYW